MIAIAFTGTKYGMSAYQMKTVRTILRDLIAKHGGISELHHGDCVGADADIHVLMRTIDPTTRIVIHPPADDKLRAWCGGDVVREPLPYLTRNQHIVKAVEPFPVRMLLAAPHQVEEVTRSGTWSTIRYARRSRVGIPIAIVQPDGTITEEP